MLPYKCEPLQQYPLALFRSRWAHKRGRCLLQLLSTCKKSRSNCTYNRGCGSDQCEARLIINGNGICHIVIHNPISSYNNVWNDFLSDQHSQHTAKKSCKKMLTDIFCCNSRLLISQCFKVPIWVRCSSTIRVIVVRLINAATRKKMTGKT